MSITQFAMVEELASLIKDNVSSRHLVLAVEEAFVNYLQDDLSPNGVLELEPMSSYNRLIIHRLADIFGFIHESVGEGDDRHLVLQRYSETSIPSILVSDILWQYDACESPTVPYQLLRRDDSCTVLKMNLASSPNIVEREAAYLAARERIFGTDDGELKEAAQQRPRNVPVVARRMIAHALGQRINNENGAQVFEGRHTNEQTVLNDIERKVKVTSVDSNVHKEKSVSSLMVKGKNSNDRPGVRNRLADPKISMKEENLGAAKRMFAHALGIPASKEGVSKGK